MRYADTAVHVYHRPTGVGVLRGSEGALQVGLGLVEALVFVVLLWGLGEMLGELL